MGTTNWIARKKTDKQDFSILSQQIISGKLLHSNFNPPLKLLFCSPITASNNLLLKICCESVVKLL